MTAPRLLIIDDDRDFAESLAEYLELDGYNVDLAFTGESGIEKAGNDAYGAILIDVGLPGLNGVECMLEIKRSNPSVRCFLMTGYSADQIAKQGIEAGALKILKKPVDLEDLLEQLRT